MKRILLALLVTALYIAPSYGKVTYLHSTPSGTIVAATDASGKQLWVKKYTPFGTESDSGGTVDDGGTNYGYATHELDTATGLVYAKARYYDPMVGRFYSVDPCEAGLSDYSYGQNSPFMFVDPTGCVQSWAGLGRDTIGMIGSIGGMVTGFGIIGGGLFAAGTTSEFGFGLLGIPAAVGGMAIMAKSANAFGENAYDFLNNVRDLPPAEGPNLKSGLADAFGVDENNPYYSAGYDVTNFMLDLGSDRLFTKYNLLEFPELPTSLDYTGKTNDFLEAGQSIMDSASSIGSSLDVGMSSDWLTNDSSPIEIGGPSLFSDNQINFDSFNSNMGSLDNMNIYP